MDRFSRDTFDKLKHYVGVRLQQGVPLVDADWNESEDIRKYEMEAFIKWFIGNGVPQGNDGFCIVPASVFNFTEQSIKTIDPADLNSILLISGIVESTKIKNILSKLSPISPALNELPPASSYFSVRVKTALEVFDKLKASLPSLVAVKNNDFLIMGGDGTADGAGRCLVEGWDVLIENNIYYSEQLLFNKKELAEKWKVPFLPPLTTPPVTGREDTVYLDVWEREVTSKEDSNIINKAIGIETCVRQKREWVVRVAEGITPVAFNKEVEKNKLAGHVFYPIAHLKRTGSAIIGLNDIIDLRRKYSATLSELSELSEEITVKDGNVGIGTSTPKQKLHVDGSLRTGGLSTYFDGFYFDSVIRKAEDRSGYDNKYTDCKHTFEFPSSVDKEKSNSKVTALIFRITETIYGNPLLQAETKKYVEIADDWIFNAKLINTTTLYASQKHFVIDHPLFPDNKSLVHSSLEGPEVGVYYRGEAQLINGYATVALPAYFEALTIKENRTVSLTAKFEDDESISMLAASEVKNGQFKVKAIDNNNPSQMFYWEVKAVRADVPLLEVECNKHTG